MQDRCIALPLLSQHPHNLSTHADLIQSSEVYECFDGNTVEVEIMLEYLESHRITPRHVYREVSLASFELFHKLTSTGSPFQIIHHIQKQPRGFAPLIELELFSDIHAVAAGQEPSANTPRNKACRMCAAEIFLWGLKEWWIRERRKGLLEESILKRKDCPEAGRCVRQKDDLGMSLFFSGGFIAVSQRICRCSQNSSCERM